MLKPIPTPKIVTSAKVIAMPVRHTLGLIQLSRAIAPLLVLLFHASLFADGYMHYNMFGLSSIPYTGGVDFFFVLSGFMTFYISGKHIGKRDKAVSFLLNRAMRVYPIYWIITAVLVLAYILIPSLGHGYERQPMYILKSFLLIPQKIDPVINVAWSLAETMVYYFIFFILMLIPRHIAFRISAIWISLCLIATIGGTNSYILKELFGSNMLKFAIGCIAAYVILKWKIRYGKLMIILGISLFPISWMNYIYKFVYIPLPIGYVVGSALLIIGCAAIDLQRNMKIPSFLNYIGNASYSIYLSHFATLSLCTKIFMQLKMHIKIGIIPTMMISMAIAILVGCIVHGFIERPIYQKLKQNLRRNVR